MTGSLDARVQSVDQATLTPLVQLALNSETATPVDWSVQPIYGGVGHGTAIYRFTGTVQNQSVQGQSVQGQGESVEWSLVLKVLLEQTEHDDPKRWFYWQREADFYQSDWVKELPNGIRSVCCYAVSEQKDEAGSTEVWLWLEDAQDSTDSRWSLDDYHRAARHLGQFNGAYLVERPLPTEPWLSVNGTQDVVETTASSIELLQQNQDNPLIHHWLRDGHEQELMQRWRERASFYAMLDLPPQTLCHFDAGQDNLFLQNEDSDIIAIDWSYVGYGPVGAELTMLVIKELFSGKSDLSQAHDLDQAVFSGYLSGLQDVGWQGNTDLVRLGYTATAIYPGVAAIQLLLGFILDEDRRQKVEQSSGVTMEDIIEQSRNADGFVSTLLAEARDLKNRLL